MKKFIIFFLLPITLWSENILVLRFTPYQTQKDEKIESEIAKAFQSQSTETLKIDISNLSIKEVLNNLDDYKNYQSIIHGYYKKGKYKLLLYVQIYDSKKGYIYDSYSLTDPLENIKFDLQKLTEEEKKELYEPAEKRISTMVNNVLNIIKLNQEKKINYKNIQDYLLSEQIYQDIKFPIYEKSKEEQIKEALKLATSQYVTTVTKTKIKIQEAPATVYVIDEKNIKERGYRTLIDVLYDVPGFDIIHNYGIYPELIHQRGLEGTKNEKSLVYVDGILQNNLFEQGVLAGAVRFPLHNVERIEIISGPASSLYGSNAFNGVINIITKDGSNPETNIEFQGGYYETGLKNDTSFAVISTGELRALKTNVGKYNEGGKISFFHSGKTENMQFAVSGYYYKTQGPYFGGVGTLMDKRPDPYSSEYLDWLINTEINKKACGRKCIPSSGMRGYWWSPLYDNSYEDTYNIMAKFKFGNFEFKTINWQYLQGEGTFANAIQQIDTSKLAFKGSSWSFKNNAFNITYTKDITDNLTWKTDFYLLHSEILNLSSEQYPNTDGIDVYYNYYEEYTSSKEELVTHAGGSDSSYARQDYSYQITSYLNYTGIRNQNILIGTDLQYYNLPKDYGERERVEYNNIAFYIQDIIRPIQDLILTIGYRYDKNSFYGYAHTPRLGIVYYLTPKLIGKFLSSTGFRAPSAWESFSTTKQRKSNPDLKPETLNSYELGLDYRDNKFISTIDVYYNLIKNLILLSQTTDPNPNAPGSFWDQNRNIAKARVIGFENNNDIKITNDFTISFYYNYVESKYFDLPLTLTSTPSAAGRRGDSYENDLRAEILAEVLTNLGIKRTSSQIVPEEGKVPNISQNKFGIGFTFYFTNDISLNIRGNYVGSRLTRGTNEIIKKTDPYFFSKLNFRWNNFITKKMYFQLTINNITNEQFFDPGIRSANGGYYPLLHPVEQRNVWFLIGYNF
ncbi:MAG: hypothetical protein KatS3mg068_2655 [Candidatus Sericytochromatia bacterium]|nr:MAG: hypothetical protein KatS3mg068_2655 [Candidatus Sericytochromatia bacterium]GIX42087.1 MAG: hypothetical protein KatS3mg129_1820 [Leptospiraceae bacterium]